jgi:hypothetical protein
VVTARVAVGVEPFPSLKRLTDISAGMSGGDLVLSEGRFAPRGQWENQQ